MHIWVELEFFGYYINDYLYVISILSGQEEKDWQIHHEAVEQGRERTKEGKCRVGAIWNEEITAEKYMDHDTGGLFSFFYTFAIVTS